ncbi:MAG: phosphate acetyltransferase [Candidatus Omnitrophica bacterium]|nr:phosphate acetyltransferase [Candidatus Omnitrophota bacterium]
MEILDKIRQRARDKQRTIVLPEGDDKRILEAAKIIVEENLARLIILATNEAIKEKAAVAGLDLSKVEVIYPAKSLDLPEFTEKFFELRKAKGITEEQAKEQMLKPVYFGAMMVRFGKADGMVAGAINTTADVAKAAIYCIGFGEKIRTISSCFLITVPDCVYGTKGTFVFADCGIVPDPSPMQIANIAASAAELFSLLVEEEPKVALLSFSTKGSAEHPLVDKVVRAKEIIDEKYPELIADGELQLDAAIVPEVAMIKAPDSKVAGTANVLIFPDLNAGNISYKMVQRLAKADVIGPMMNGVSRPCSDLSRGCTIGEIVNAVCTTSIRVTTENK